VSIEPRQDPSRWASFCVVVGAVMFVGPGLTLLIYGLASKRVIYSLAGAGAAFTLLGIGFLSIGIALDNE
jgi:hypothetical protein